MKRLHGNTDGLKASEIRRLENLYRRRIPPGYVVTNELALDMGRLSRELRRQIGILVDRSGKIAAVMVGDHQGILIPEIAEYRAAPGRLRGVRCIHTHLKNEPLTHDDLTDLALLRLDLMAAVDLDQAGVPRRVFVAHILPQGPQEKLCEELPPLDPGHLEIGCDQLIHALESELARAWSARDTTPGVERAMLVSVTSATRQEAQDSLDELKELARSSGIEVLDTVLQQRTRVDPRFLLGRGKLQELTIAALQQSVTLIVFDQELNASQIRSITDQVALKVIDRTQLILDIFAQRARTREGKLQVELAQLKYLLPRLAHKTTALSRLTGGIGGRGPGETKLEIDRRRVRERIGRLERELESTRRQRHQQKARRSKKGLPVISIIGYTNAGKSTLLNTLTHSRVLAESRLFATLDPSSRRLRFPRDIEVIITDTVGFIRDLPEDLRVAFRATLEELESADLLLHVVDISNPRYQQQVDSVEKILEELDLATIPTIRVLNKKDRLDDDALQACLNRLGGVAVSAPRRDTLMPLVERIQDIVETLTARRPGPVADP
ncbi:MAG: GTPase HflX [Desulfobacterales bacterium]